MYNRQHAVLNSVRAELSHINVVENFSAVPRASRDFHRARLCSRQRCLNYPVLFFGLSAPRLIRSGGQSCPLFRPAEMQKDISPNNYINFKKYLEI